MTKSARAAKPQQLGPELDQLAEELEKAVERYEEEVEAGRVAERKLAAARAALAALREEQPAAAPERRRKPKAPKPRAARSKKRAAAPRKKAAKAASPKKGPKIAPDEPRVAKGRMPTKGVQMHVCDDAADRKRKVDELLEEGFKRTGAGHPLVPGTFDVRDTPDGATILWRPRAESS